MKILVIGIGPGVGLATARRFGREGFEVVMVARKAQKLQEFQDQLAADNIRSTAYPADIADATAFKQVLEQIVREHNDIEVLHYNPSAYNPAMPSELSLPVFLSDFNINVVGGLLAYQAVFPQMKARQRGAVFLTGGGTALQAPPMLASLGVGKAGLRNPCLFTGSGMQPFAYPCGHHHHLRHDSAGHQIRPGFDCRRILATLLPAAERMADRNCDAVKKIFLF